MSARKVLGVFTAVVILAASAGCGTTPSQSTGSPTSAAPTGTTPSPSATPSSEASPANAYDLGGEVELTDSDGYKVSVSYWIASARGFVVDVSDSKPGYAKVVLSQPEWGVTFTNLTPGRIAPIPKIAKPVWAYPARTALCGRGAGGGPLPQGFIYDVKGVAIKAGATCTVTLIDFAEAAAFKGKSQLNPNESLRITNSDVSSPYLTRLGVSTSETVAYDSARILNSPQAGGFVAFVGAEGVVNSSSGSHLANTRTCSAKTDYGVAVLTTIYADSAVGTSMCRAVKGR